MMMKPCSVAPSWCGGCDSHFSQSKQDLWVNFRGSMVHLFSLVHSSDISSILHMLAPSPIWTLNCSRMKNFVLEKMASEPRPRLRMNVVNQVMKNGCSLSLCHDRSMCIQSKPNQCTHIVEKVFRKSDEGSKQRSMILPTNGFPPRIGEEVTRVTCAK